MHNELFHGKLNVVKLGKQLNSAQPLAHFSPPSGTGTELEKKKERRKGGMEGEREGGKKGGREESLAINFF